MTILPPDELAKLDQSVAQVSEKLDEMIDGYHHATYMSDMQVGEESIYLMSTAALALTSHESCAELLACAVDRLYRAR